MKYTIVGKTCTLTGAATGTSSSNAMTMTGVPANCNPSTGASVVACVLESNGVNVGGWAAITTGNQINFGTGIDNLATGFFPTGTKGLPAGWAVTYSLL